jgi:hypothetical protein
MAKKDLNKIMKARLDEAQEAFNAAQERSANTVDRKINWDIESDFEESTKATSDSSGWDVSIPNDVKDAGLDVQTAPTINPKRPRAYTIAYNFNTNTLVVIFRKNVWWQYNQVPVSTWQGLKNSTSTGRYLRDSGLDNWGDMGPADLDALSAGTKERLSYSAEVAGRMQSGLITLDEQLFMYRDQS